jgi:hypothetical protein
MSGLFSALIAKRITEKKEKVAAIKASHKKCVYLYLNISSAARLTFQSQDCIGAGSCLSGFALHCTFSCSLGSCGAIYSCPVTFMSHTSLTRFYTSDTQQGYLHIIRCMNDTGGNIIARTPVPTWYVQHTPHPRGAWVVHNPFQGHLNDIMILSMHKYCITPATTISLPHLFHLQCYK